MRSRPVFSDGKVHLRREMCATCIFRPGNQMHLQPGRVAGMVKDCLSDVDEAGNIPCHETIHGLAPQQAICRGFWDRYADRLLTLRLAQFMNIVEEV